MLILSMNTQARGRQYFGSSHLDFPSNFSFIYPGYDCDTPMPTSQRSFPTDGGIRQSETAIGQNTTALPLAIMSESELDKLKLRTCPGSYNITCGLTEDPQDDFSCCVSASGFIYQFFSL